MKLPAGLPPRHLRAYMELTRLGVVYTLALAAGDGGRRLEWWWPADELGPDRWETVTPRGGRHYPSEHPTPPRHGRCR